MALSTVPLCIAELEQKSYVDCDKVARTSKEFHQLKIRKQELKREFLDYESEQLFLEYLGKDPAEWPSLSEAEKSLHESSENAKRAKEAFELEKEKISGICDSVSAEIERTKDLLKLLKEKMAVLENKKVAFERRRGGGTTTVTNKTLQIQANIKHIQGVIEQQTGKLQEKEAAIASLQEQLTNRQLTAQHSQDRGASVLSFLETVDGLKVEATGKDRLQVEFVSGAEELRLLLTLTFQSGCYGNTVLSDVQANIEKFKMDDLVVEAKQTGDIPSLIRSVQERWQQHRPMFSEMDYLIKHYAVDWIQEKSLLRVLVGSTGNLIVTLKIPEDYPASREITVVEGISDLKMQDVPPATSSLRTWVTYLEDKFGRF